MDRRTVAGTFCASLIGSGLTALVAWDTVPTSTIHDALAWFGVAGAAIGSGGLFYLWVTGSKPVEAPRHPDGIYQYGQRVGGVAGAFEDTQENVFRFDALTATQDFDREANFEYRTFVLELARYRNFNRSEGGGGRFTDAVCRILNRA